MLAFHSVLILIISFIGLAHAADDTGWASVGEPTQAPPGWIEFCKANPAECQAGATTPRDIVLSDKAIEDLKKVNSWVNGTVKVKEDIDHWGVIEKWSLPTDGFGDSEDFVLLKRKTLLNAGWPREALLITVVQPGKDPKIAHAVLTVKTDKGEFILTEETNDILPWVDSRKRFGYRFGIRQSQSDPNVWVTLGEKRTGSIGATTSPIVDFDTSSK